jgi:hypothetical protein
MERWDLIRERIEQYLGERSSAKERAYRSRRQALANDLGMADVTLKGFLPAHRSRSEKSKSGTLGLDKLRKLLEKPDFHDLRSEFPELGPGAFQAQVLTEIQLELDFEGFDVAPQRSTLLLPVGREGKVRLTITKTA